MHSAALVQLRITGPLSYSRDHGPHDEGFILGLEIIYSMVAPTADCWGF